LRDGASSDESPPGRIQPGHIQEIKSDPVTCADSVGVSTPAALTTTITSPADIAGGTAILQIVTTSRHNAVRHNSATFPIGY
jgi:hypothetical protein